MLTYDNDDEHKVMKTDAMGFIWTGELKLNTW
jgi:hypothetical protein